jgi:hypothetical protein
MPEEAFMRTNMQTVNNTLAAGSFVSEVEEFRVAIADPSVTFDAKKRAYGTIVVHAALLDPKDEGFWGAGVALKSALCAWLDYQPMTEH